MVNQFLENIPSPPVDPIPFWKEIFEYKGRFFKRDIFAAIVVALTALPQSMAYAFLADLPTQSGIFAAIFGTMFTSAFGSSRYLVSGTSNLMAILIQSGMSEILSTFYPEILGAERDLLAMQLLTQIVFLIGVFQILSAFFKVGRAMQFASRAVILGYTAGAAFAILSNQLYPFFGIRSMGGYHPIYKEVWFFITHLSQIQILTTTIGIGSLLLLIIGRRLSPRTPSTIIVFILAGAGVYFLFHTNILTQLPQIFHQKVALISDLGFIKLDFSSWKIPIFHLDLLIKVVPLSFALALLSLLEATSIIRSYSVSKESKYNDNQQSFGLGVSNLFTSFIGAMPSSGSFSRTFLNYASGAKTRFASIFSGIFLAVVILFLKAFVLSIPLCALSALMVLTAYTMVNFRHLILCFRCSFQDGTVVFVTFCASLFFSLDVAFYIGVILSIVMYLKQAGQMRLTEYTFNQLGKLRPMDPSDERLDERICIVHVGGDLFFGAADPLLLQLKEISEEEGVSVIILQMINIQYIDASVCLAFIQVIQLLQKRKQTLLISGVSDYIFNVFIHTGFIEILGAKQLFRANEQIPSEPTKHAYAFAKKIAKLSNA